MNSKMAISFVNVSKTFKVWQDRPQSLKSLLTDYFINHINPRVHKQPVLMNLSFQINQGEFVGIMGRNGAGKSTILKIICGIYNADEGKVVVQGRIAPLIELGAGFSGDLSGYENILLNGAILGFGKKSVSSAIDQIIKFSELGEHIYRPVKNYSSGMLVRLGFSIATHLPFEILLIDEILAVGDIGFQEKCSLKIRELQTAGVTILLITHSPEQIAKFCDRCILIDGHRIVFDGLASEGSQKYKELFPAVT